MMLNEKIIIENKMLLYHYILNRAVIKTLIYI